METFEGPKIARTRAVDVSSLSSQLAKSQSHTVCSSDNLAGSSVYRSGSEPARNGVRLPDMNEEDLNRDTVGGDAGAVVVAETEFTSVKTNFGGPNRVFLSDGKEAEKGTDSGLGVEKTEFNGNGISLVVEVRGSLGTANESDKKCAYADDKGSLTENGRITRGKFTKQPGAMSNVGERMRNYNRGEKEEDSDSDSDDDDDDDDDYGGDMGDQEHNYSVGDFVWGKIKSHPWWPGQVYDPSDASEFAAKYKQRGRLLVAYFGDGSFSWCYPSQLEPFAENFEVMLKQSNSKTFVNAVKMALDEIGRLVELQMTCSCVSDLHVALTRPLAVNAGIRAGVLVPEGGIYKLSIPMLEPAELLANLQYVAQLVSISSMLELTIVKSWLSAFYHLKTGCPLPIYHERLDIEGLDDKNKNVLIDSSDLNDTQEVSIQGSFEEDWLSLPVGPGNKQTNRSGPEISEGKLYQRRKQKSVAQLLNEGMDVEPKNKKGSMAEEGVQLGKSTSGKKRRKGNDEAENDGDSSLASPSGKKKGRKKKVGILGSPKTTGNSVSTAENGDVAREEAADEGPLSKASKMNNVSTVENEDGNALTSQPGKKRGRKKKDEILGSLKTCGNNVSTAEIGGVAREEAADEGPLSKVSKRKGVSTVENDYDSALTYPSGKRRGRKKKDQILESPKTTGNDVSTVENSGLGREEAADEGPLSKTLDRKKVSTVENDDGSALTSPSGKKRGKKKKKAEMLGSLKTTGNNVSTAEDGGVGREEAVDEGLLSKTSNRNKVSTVENDDDSALTSPSGKKRERKKKVEKPGSLKITGNNVSTAENGGVGHEAAADEGPLSMALKWKKVSTVENDDGDTKEETEKGFASRERKKSKYLSPPYTSPKWGGRDSSFKSDSEAESEKIAKTARMGERMTKAAGQLFGSPPILECSGETFQKKLRKIGGRPYTSGISSSQTQDRESMINSMQINASASEVLSGVLSAGLSPPQLRERKFYDMVIGFVSAFRNSVYLNGPNYKMYHKRRAGRKRKSLNAEPASLGQDLSRAARESSEPGIQQTHREKKEQAKSGMPKLEKAARVSEGGSLQKGREKQEQSGMPNLKKAAGTSGLKTRDKDVDGKASPVTLMVTFPPGFSLPSKNDLIKLFSKFGALNEMETDVSYNSYCARIVFLMSSDAEAAFNKCASKSPFGVANVSYRLRYSSTSSRAPKTNRKASPQLKTTLENPVASQLSDDNGLPLGFIKQKLEMMTSMLENCGGRISPEMKSKLEGEMKGLLEKVCSMPVSNP